MLRIFRRLASGTEAQDLIEYALLIAFIALVSMSAVGALGNQVYEVLYKDLAQDLFGGS